MFQDALKRLKRAAARNSLYFSTWFLNRLPYSIVRSLTDVLVAIGFRLTLRQRTIARESLQIAFGSSKDPREVDQIIRMCFENFGRGMIELIYFMEHPQMIRERVFFEGKHFLDEAFQEQKGVIVVSAHFGNFPLMLLRCVQEGYKTHAIIRPARDEAIEKHFLKQRQKFGLNTIYSHPRRKCVETSLRVLRNNELLFIPLDQNFGSKGGVFVDFFGQKAATATGPVVFALRTQAPVVPMFIVRGKDDTHKIIVEPALKLDEKEDDQEAILANTAKITSTIERYVRKYPQEWGWMHRRWKSRPSDDQPSND